MVAVVLFGFLLTAVLVVLLARFAPPLAVGREQLNEQRDRRPAIPSPALHTVAVELLAALGLIVADEELPGDEGRLIAVRREPFGDTRYIVFLEPAPAGGVVDQASILELAEDVKSERGSIGMLITPGRFEAAGLDVPLQLIDGARFRELVSKHLPERLGLLDRYRGFGAAIAAVEPLQPQPS